MDVLDLRKIWLDHPIKSGSNEKYVIEEFEVPKERTVASLRLGARAPKPGTYVKLQEARGFREIWMSNTTAEFSDHSSFLQKATGRVLINGLGLGCALNVVLNKPDVSFVKVVELDPKVIELVGPYFTKNFGDKVEIVEGNALEYKPKRGEKYDCAWHDIWVGICADNWKDMLALASKWKNRVKYQDSWCKDEVKRAVAQERRQRW